MFVGDAAAVPAFAELGISVFVVGSDQSMLRAGLTKLARDFSMQNAQRTQTR
jgi:2-keto-3-deoxy-L-rhamnonate aldolase RhmA